MIGRLFEVEDEEEEEGKEEKEEKEEEILIPALACLYNYRFPS